MNRDSKRPNLKENKSALDRVLDTSEKTFEMKMTKAAHSVMEEALKDDSSMVSFHHFLYSIGHPFQQASPTASGCSTVCSSARSSPMPLNGSEDYVVEAFFV